MATIDNQIRNYPMFLAKPNGVHREAKQLRPSKPTSYEKRKHRVIALAAQRIRTRSLQQPFSLLGREPVSNPYAQAAYSLHTANASGQFRTQQARIRCLIGNSPDRREAQINR
jgi:hypothetical protein